MIGTVISVVALGVSLFVLVDSRRRDRRDLLLKLHEQLNAQDRSIGRRLLYRLAGQPVESWGDDQFDRVNNALAYFDVIGACTPNWGTSRRTTCCGCGPNRRIGRGEQRSRSSISEPDRAGPGHGPTSRGWPGVRKRIYANADHLW
jgi:hypothetical protein